jgi:hypothetical protein
VTFDPAVTVAGPVLVIARSALCVTVVVTLAVLFDEFVSKLSDETVAVFVIELVLPVLMVRLNWAEAPLPSERNEHVTLPFAPTAGLEQVAAGPFDWIIDTNVVPAGSGSLRITFDAPSGPLFVTVSV